MFPFSLKRIFYPKKRTSKTRYWGSLNNFSFESSNMEKIRRSDPNCPPLLPTTASNLEFDFSDYIPDDVYFHDEEYVC